MTSHHWLEPNWNSKVTLPSLPFKKFIEKGIKAIVLDVDGTLLPGKETNLAVSTQEWVDTAKSHFVLHLFSNNPSKKRIGAVANQLNLPFISGAAKPRRFHLRKLIDELKLQPYEIAIVGDRIFTDVLAGNRLGLYTVLVKPLSKDSKTNKDEILQLIEKIIAKSLGAKSL